MQYIGAENMEICNMSECTGCSACSSSCPQKAITLLKDEKGFFHPQIKEEMCVKCGICKKVCHINKQIKTNQVKTKYIFRNNDFEVRKNSSSGGTFIPLAEVVINNNGNVFGAEFDDEFQVRHNNYKDIVNVRKFSTSKYVQSAMNESFVRVYELLTDNELVLFSGTPCQVAGLLSYLEQKKCKTDNLITIDFICHGVGSPRFWGDCLDYYAKKYKSNIVHANFRGKPRPGKLQNLELFFENGRKYYAPSANSEMFFYHFLKNYIIRESCFSCKYCKTERISDITIGDCFKPDDKYSYLQDGYGLSQIMANTEKGINLVKEISSNGDMVEVNTNDYIQFNMLKNTPRPKKYNEFWNNYLKSGYKNAMKVSEYTSAKIQTKKMVLTVAYFLKIDSIIKKLVIRIKHHS